jgi:hypothetical protein
MSQKQMQGPRIQIDTPSRNMQMEHHWLSLKSAIIVATGFILTYMISILIELPISWILVLCLLSMVASVWMVIRILKDPYSTDKTFDEFFYQDREDIRRYGKD